MRYIYTFTFIIASSVINAAWAGPISCQMYVTFENNFNSVIKVKSISDTGHGYEKFSTMSIQANQRRKTNRKRRLLTQVVTYNKAMKQGETRQIFVSFKIYNPQQRNWINLTTNTYTRTCQNGKNMFFPLEQNRFRTQSKQALQSAGMWVGT